MNYLDNIKAWKLGNTSKVDAVRDALLHGDDGGEALAESLTEAVNEFIISDSDVKSWNATLNREIHKAAQYAWENTTDKPFVKGNGYEVFGFKWHKAESEMVYGLVNTRKHTPKDAPAKDEAGEAEPTQAEPKDEFLSKVAKFAATASDQDKAMVARLIDTIEANR